MIMAQNISVVIADCISSFAIGILLCIVYHLLRFVTGTNKKILFIRDIIFTICAAILSSSYAITYSFYGSLRWYMLISIGAGLLLYRNFMLKPLFSKEQYLKQQVAVPIKKASQKTQDIVGLMTENGVEYIKKRFSEKKTFKKQLPKQLYLLYNSDSSLQEYQKEIRIGKKPTDTKKTKQSLYKAVCSDSRILSAFSACSNTDRDKSKKG